MMAWLLFQLSKDGDFLYFLADAAVTAVREYTALFNRN